MEYFICEVFDVPNVSHVPDLFSDVIGICPKLKTHVLIYENIYKHPLLILSLVICYAWEKCLGIYPSKIDVHTIINKPLINVNLHKIRKLNISFGSNQKDKDTLIFQITDSIFHILLEYTFLKYFGNESCMKVIGYKKDTSQFLFNLLKNENNFTKNAISNKLKKRICPNISIFKTSVNNNEYNELNFELEKKRYTQSLYDYFIQLSSFIYGFSKAEEYYEKSKIIIYEQNFLLKNIYTGFTIFPIDDVLEKYKYVKHWKALNISESVCFQLNHDLYFMRLLLNNPVLVTMQGNQTFYDIVHNIMNDKCQKPTFVFHLNHHQSMNHTTLMHNIDIYNHCVSRISSIFVYTHYPEHQNSENEGFFIQPKSIYNIDIILTKVRSKKNIEERGFFEESSKISSEIQIVSTKMEVISAEQLFIPFFQDNTYLFDFTANFLNTFFSYWVSLLQQTKEVNVNQLKHKHLMNTLRLAKNLIFDRFARIPTFGLSSLSTSMNNDKTKSKKNTLLYVDTRPNIMGICTLKITLHHLDDNIWNIVVLTKRNERPYYTHHLGSNVDFIESELMEKANFDIEDYNLILKSSHMWSQIKKLGYDKCLIIQDDSMILRKGMESDFLHYDFVSSPWRKVDGNEPLIHYIGSDFIGGNGGLSLRNVELMETICDKFEYEKNLLFNQTLQPIPEDVYFSMCVYKMIKMGFSIKTPNYKQSSFFGVEQVYNINAYGIHKFWVYNTPHEVFEYFSKLPS
jgi:hypothetical protein